MLHHGGGEKKYKEHSENITCLVIETLHALCEVAAAHMHVYTACESAALLLSAQSF